MTQTTHTIYEHTFSPQQAGIIVEATKAAGYNFRAARAGGQTVQHLADAMRSGNWKWTDAAPIRLSSDWTLVSDGLHRLTACRVSGVPLRSLVLVGEQWEANLNTDRGRNRTVAQFAQNQGVTNATKKAAITRKHLSRLAAHRRGIGVAQAGVVYVQEQDIIDFIEKNDTELSWAAAKGAAAMARGFNANGYGTFLLESRQIDAGLASDFHEEFASCNELDDTPIAKLSAFARRRFQATGKRMNDMSTTDAFVKAWNLTMEGAQVKMWKPPMWGKVVFPSGFNPPT